MWRAYASNFTTSDTIISGLFPEHEGPTSPQDNPSEWTGCWLADAYETRKKVARIIEEV